MLKSLIKTKFQRIFTKALLVPIFGSGLPQIAEQVMASRYDAEN